jgi:hypothetical protein
MSKHNDIYSILGKLNSLAPKQPTAKQPVVEDNSSSFKKDLVQRLSESYVAEKDMGKHNNATTGFKALAKKAGGGEKGERIAGAQFQKMKKAGQLEEEGMSRAAKGYEKYGKQGMEALAKAGREGKDLDKVRDKYDRYDESAVDEDMLSKPDYVDLDKDGNKKEPMKKAAKDAKKSMHETDFGQHDSGEYDREGEMADQDLETAEDAAEELRSILSADENLPEWVQAKITKAVDYLDTARDYMQSKDSGEEVQEGEYKDSPNKSDVPAFQRKAKGGDWKVSTKDLDDEASKSPTGSAGLAKAKERLGMKEGQTIQTKTGLIHKGSYGSDYQGSDEEDDDYGSPKSSTGEKKRGRPRIHAMKDPNAPKRGRGRPKKVAEHINLSTFVEDTLAEMAAIYEGKPDFLDMDKDGNKKEPMKKAVADKKKNPFGNKKEVKESKQLNESSLQAIVRKFGKEVREFAQGGDMDNDLFEALYDYYFDDMPYGVKKARDGDPYEWVADHFDQAIQGGDIEVSESNVPALEGDMELDELARLAGLHGGQKKLDRNHNNKLDSEDFAMLRQGTNESECNMTAEGDMCPKHGFSECWSASMMESKPDFLDMDKDGDKKEPMKKAVADKDDEEKVDEAMNRQERQRAADTQSARERAIANNPNIAAEVERRRKKAEADKAEKADKEKVDECGDMGPTSGGMTRPESSMSVNTSMSSKGDKSVNVTATGQEADKLMQLLRLAGIGGNGQNEPHSAPRVVAMSAGGEEAPGADVEVDEEYGNTDVKAVPPGVQSPKPEYSTVKQQMQQGADLNRPKAQYKHNYKGGDNPMGMREETMKLESRLAAEYEYLKKAK